MRVKIDDKELQEKLEEVQTAMNVIAKNMTWLSDLCSLELSPTGKEAPAGEGDYNTVATSQQRVEGMDSQNKSELESMKQAISGYVVKTLTEGQDTEKISLAATLIYGYSELTKLENPSAK